MSRSLHNLRRGLLGIAFVGSLGFGVTQVFATPQQTRGPHPRCAYGETRCFCYDGSSICVELAPGEPCPAC